MYYCKTSNYSCQQTSSTYTSIANCEANLQQYLPGQTTGICYVASNSCSANCYAGWTPPPWTPPISPLPSNQPVISEFKITNFTQRTDASSGVPFYFILSPQMQAGYKANIAWSVSGATSCSASCVYKDENGTQLPDQPGQANDCQWWGTVDPNGGNQGVQPKWQGTVQYNLTCVNGTLSDSKTFNAAIRQFSWQEVLGNQIAKFAALFR